MATWLDVRMVVETFMTPLVRKECQERTSIASYDFPLWLDIVSGHHQRTNDAALSEATKRLANQRTLLGQVPGGEPYRVGVSYPR